MAGSSGYGYYNPWPSRSRVADVNLGSYPSGTPFPPVRMRTGGCLQNLALVVWSHNLGSQQILRRSLHPCKLHGHSLIAEIGPLGPASNIYA